MAQKGPGIKSSNRTIEKRYVEMLQRVHPLPPGELKFGDKPDVIIHGPRKIGIEITRFYRTDGVSAHAEQVQAPRRRKAVANAEKMFRSRGGGNLGLACGFDERHPIVSVQTVAEKIATLACTIVDHDNGQVERPLYRHIPELDFVHVHTRTLQHAEESDPEFPSGQPDVAEGFAIWSRYRNRREARARERGVYKPLDRPVRWHVSQGHSFGRMSEGRLLGIIRAKELSAKDYTPCDALWLLVVADSMDAAQEQDIRSDVVNVRSNVFEKIILYQPLFEQVLELSAAATLP